MASKSVQKSAGTHNSHNGWVPKTTKSVILVCKSCSAKYIKTRSPQPTCLKCMLVPRENAVFRLRKD